MARIEVRLLNGCSLALFKILMDSEAVNGRARRAQQTKVNKRHFSFILPRLCSNHQIDIKYLR